MSLNKKLQQIRSASLERIPEEAAAIMVKSVKELAESGVVDNALDKGDAAPDFVLHDFQGHQHASADLLAKGPVILTFYRGSW